MVKICNCGAVGVIFVLFLGSSYVFGVVFFYLSV